MDDAAMLHGDARDDTPSLSSPQPLLRVGERVEEVGDDGAIGIVRYVGPVATSNDPTAIYYGIEWDVWGRGRHDGSVVVPSTGERIVYFNGPAGRVPIATSPRSSSSPTSPSKSLVFKCSFVKASKFRIKPPQSLLQRLIERYGLAIPPTEATTEATAMCTDDIVTAGAVGTTLGSHKPIELVGVAKLQTQQTLASVEKITLAHLQIASIASTGTNDSDVTNDAALYELTHLTPNICELDLSCNLLHKWSEVLQMAAALPKLSTLILTGNRLQFDVDAIAIGQLTHVTMLVLNETLMDASDVRTLLDSHFPNVTELHLVGNDLSNADLTVLLQTPIATNGTNGTNDPSTWRTALQVLDLSHNRLTDWSILQATVGSQLPQLDQLNVSGNQFVAIVTNDFPLQAFPSLTTLSLSDNCIDAWRSIDALDALPALATLRLTRNPLLAAMGAGEVRMAVIARLAHLVNINGSVVRATERTDAEQLYLKRILYELHAIASAGSDTQQQQRVVQASHPRFDALCQLYPDVVARVADDARSSGGDNSSTRSSSSGPATLAASLVRVTIIPMSMDATTFESLTKRVPETMTIAQLKQWIAKKFGVDATNQALAFRPNARSMPCPLDDDSAEMRYYGLQDGAEILVNDK